MVCEACGFDAGPEDAFCEGCGRRLGGSDTASSAGALPAGAGCPCGATARDAEGYCLSCGRKAPGVRASESEAVDATLAWVSDQGRIHTENQDAAGVLRLGDGTVVLVVSDGVSSADRAAEASRLAVRTILARAQGGIAAPEIWLSEAIAEAHAALLTMARADQRKDDPQATVVVAVVRDAMAWYGWLGDSRLYLLHAAGNAQLTVDDSWANEAIASGLPTSLAMQAEYAHCITQCLGMRESAPAIHVGQRPIPATGTLLLCSDGLWNYLPEPDLLAEVAAGNSIDAVVRCQTLVDRANAAGGADNISAALLQC